MRFFVVISFLCLIPPWAQGLSQGIQSFQLTTGLSPRPPSNYVDAINVSGDTVWFGTENSLAIKVDGQGWRNLVNSDPFDNTSISAIALRSSLVWTATGYSRRKDGQDIQVGGGLNWSSDAGLTWTHVPQPVDVGTVDTISYGVNKIRALAITVPEQNITFDIAVTQSSVWIASFAGMLRRSSDFGTTWERVVLPPDNLDSISPNDSLDFDLSPSGGSLGLRESLNHRVFSVYAEADSTLWVGTAGGINYSTDGGTKWTKFTHLNQAKSISGNWVVAINEQSYMGKRTLWAATRPTIFPTEQLGVSFSKDSGKTWSTTLLGERAHNITFKDSIVYVATDGGVFRSSDGGSSWLRNGTIYDKDNLQRFTQSPIFAVGVQGDTVWVGGSEGIASTVDSQFEPFGSSWHIFRTYEPSGVTTRTYSFPSPFSPDDESVRIHYRTNESTSSVTIRIFDFGMQPVRTLIQNAPRPAASELDEVWNGFDDRGNIVTNGVYFYRIELENNDPLWGKILVIR